MDFNDFESWFESHKHLMKEQVRKGIEANRGYLNFVFVWKEYERLAGPRLRALLSEQYPGLVHAENFAAHVAKNIEHRCFELIEEIWKVNTWNMEGKKPQEVLKTLYPVILRSKAQWQQPLKLHTVEEVLANPDHINWTREDAEYWVPRWNRDKQRAFNYLEKFREQFIDAMQPDLLALLPNLLNMEREWWDVYVFYLRFQCENWKSWNDRYSFLVEKGQGPEHLKTRDKKAG